MKKQGKSYKSPSTCLGYPNALWPAHIDDNYCRAHVRFGQAVVDAWGAERRRSLPKDFREISHSSEYAPIAQGERDRG